ncbi:MAG: DUF3035 domain-containing protein [Alphaproteobacteria bacterium]|nr:DUF3035 domain-containing protein [Alphaproteobacteria bacterium]
MSKMLRISVAVLGLSFLSACSGDVGKVLGFEKQAPDEFAVVKRAPLVLPPDFGLRPPDPNQRRVEDDQARELAQAALFGTESARQKRENLKQAEQKFAGGELALLKQSEAIGANSDIRILVDNESEKLALANDTFIKNLMFWKEYDDGVIVDAAAENERINENTSLGRDLTEGETPMIIRNGEGSIFGDASLFD